MFSTTSAIQEGEIYHILANRRRRETIRHLTVTAGPGPVSVSELSRAVASREAGTAPPPRSLRESVYNSLHQTHLPKLHELEVLQYDRDQRMVQLRQGARDVDRYMDLVAGFGVTWGELYRTLGVLSLSVVLGSLIDIPLVSRVDPVLWSTLFLLLFAAAVGTELWSNRWLVVHALYPSVGCE